MSVDDNRDLTSGLWRAIALYLSVIMASFFFSLHHPVEEVKIYL